MTKAVVADLEGGNKKATRTARTNSGRYFDLDADKLRGGYYTPRDIAEWLCAWAIRTKNDVVLEPSCGDGAFLEAAASQLRALGSRGAECADQLFGIEIIAEEADRTRSRLASKAGIQEDDVVETGDFFAWWKRSRRPLFDVVVGNPPFIRYQSFPEPHRSRAMQIMKEQGLSPNKLTNIWVPFVVAAAATLRTGGRMALVLPAELLQVSYAAQLRSFLTNRFGRLDLIACNELFFKNAEQEVLLLLADEARPPPPEKNSCRVALTESNLVKDITDRTPASVLGSASPKTVRHDSEKWLKYFLKGSEIALMRELRDSEAATPLSTFASVNVGVVTGKNQFFVLRKSEIEAHGLQQYMVPLVSRTSHLIGARFGNGDWSQLVVEDQRVNLLHLATMNGKILNGALQNYIRMGEQQNVHEGYKCSIRDPWYKVPSVWVPDAFVFRQIYDFPRMVRNTAKATSTDTIHRMQCKTDPSTTVANAYTSLTAASAEIEGRSYGGGVLELEPTEAARLLMPAYLGPALPLEESDRLVRLDRLNDVLDANDRLILRETMGLSLSDCLMLRGIWEKMRDRRRSRRRNIRSSRR